MTTTLDLPEYLLLLRNTRLEETLSPAEMQEAMGRFTAWLDRMTSEGKLKAGQPLANDSRIVAGRKSRTVADGPFAEAKESVGGYLVLTVSDLDEAVTEAEECPLLDYGVLVEVRPIIAQCAAMQRVSEELARASV